jgi:hypothetical protein
MASTLALIWWLYGYRLRKQAQREGNFALIYYPPPAGFSTDRRWLAGVLTHNRLTI